MDYWNLIRKIAKERAVSLREAQRIHQESKPEIDDFVPRGKQIAKKSRRHLTIRMSDSERAQVQSLAQDLDSKSLFEALQILTPIVNEMQCGKREFLNRPLRIGIPTNLDEAIREKVRQTNFSIREVLFQAIEIALSRHSP